MLTLKEIAADLGVSHTLVSRVVSGRMGTTRVSEATRLAILKRAKEVDYQPNRFALALKQGHKGIVGLFVHDVGTRGSELNERFIHAAADALGEMNLRLWLRFFHHDEEFLAACTPSLRREMDGLIVAGIPHPDLTMNLIEIEKEGLPVVCAFHETHPSPLVTNVQVDHAMQAHLATRHLIEMGCRRIARFHRNEDRQLGYLRALEEGGLAFDPALEVEAERYRYADGLNCMERLMGTGRKFDGLVAESDAQAAGAIHYLARTSGLGEFCPLVVGFDDSPIAEDCLVPLTSVTAEMEATAVTAIKALTDKMEGKSTESSLLPASLVVRESTDRRKLMSAFRDLGGKS